MRNISSNLLFVQNLLLKWLQNKEFEKIKIFLPLLIRIEKTLVSKHISLIIRNGQEFVSNSKQFILLFRIRNGIYFISILFLIRNEFKQKNFRNKIIFISS